MKYTPRLLFPTFHFLWLAYWNRKFSTFVVSLYKPHPRVQIGAGKWQCCGAVSSVCWRWQSPDVLGHVSVIISVYAVFYYLLNNVIARAVSMANMKAILLWGLWRLPSLEMMGARCLTSLKNSVSKIYFLKNLNKSVIFTCKQCTLKVC